jgi:hypothetical protein
MKTEETKDNREGAKSMDFGCAPLGQGMVEMMRKCCTGQGGSPDCSSMMKNMMETMNKQACCASKEDSK